MKMKKKAATAPKKGARPKKGGATKKGAAVKKPAEKPPPPRKAAAPAEPKPAATQTVKRAGTYTPSPVQGMGWAPFRYPPQ